jgi:polysaccharide pyruvyl transferase WcaK-like protein
MAAKTIILFGTYAEENTGDDYLLVSQIEHIRRRCPDCRIVVFTGNRDLTRQMLQRQEIALTGIRLVYTGRWGLAEPDLAFPGSLAWFFRNILEIFRADLLIIGPGNQIQDVTRRMRVVFFLSRAVLAWLLRTPYAFLGIGFYELRNAFCRWLLRFTGNRAAFFSTRDQGGADKTREIGLAPEKIVALADVSFARRWAPMKVALANEEMLIGVTSRIFLPSVFPPAVALNLEDSLAALLRQIHETYDARFLFFPYYKGSHWKDAVAYDRLIDRLGGGDFPLRPFPFSTLEELRAGTVRCRAFIGTRYHSVLLSVQNGIPVLGISYAHKTQRFMEENGLGEYVVRVEDVSPARLWRTWNGLWDDRESIREKMADINARERWLADRHFDLVFDALAAGSSVELPTKETSMKVESITPLNFRRKGGQIFD